MIHTQLKNKFTNLYRTFFDECDCVRFPHSHDNHPFQPRLRFVPGTLNSVASFYLLSLHIIYSYTKKKNLNFLNQREVKTDNVFAENQLRNVSWKNLLIASFYLNVVENLHATKLFPNKQKRNKLKTNLEVRVVPLKLYLIKSNLPLW